ncbi:unnamed protein product [Sphagnum jensenii]|uniref:Uncharacterized protein n=1 Tax=Sphagnum jensenii TaxID=128206 RepID=A0ABP1AC20_9BRYO
MGQAYMSKFDRLTFARRKEMIELQDVAIKALPESSVHGISNIAWTLSTISGSAIYFGELDLMDFQPQELVQFLWAFASKNHHPLDDFFDSLNSLVQKESFMSTNLFKNLS